MLTTDGIVLRERHAGESDKFIDILTQDSGVIEVCVKGARKLGSKNHATTQPFTYASFCISSRGDRNYLNSSELIKSFYALRLDLQKLSLASYFSEITAFAAGNQEQGGELLRLFLNTVYYLSRGDRSLALLKSVYELRFLAEIGLMPDLLACHGCGKYECEKMFFHLSEGTLLCEQCYDGHEGERVVSLTPSVLKAMRHITLAGFDRLYNFKISEMSSNKLSFITERFLLTQLDASFKTLDFYKTTLDDE